MKKKATTYQKQKFSARLTLDGTGMRKKTN
jgi:hypothetical protein